MTTLGQRLALVELAEVRRELGVLGEKLDDVIVALGGDVLDLRDAGPDATMPRDPEGRGAHRPVGEG